MLLVKYWLLVRRGKTGRSTIAKHTMAHSSLKYTWAKNYNKESILLPALVKQNGFDYYTLSLLKSLPDDFMLSSNHISVIIEQCNYQENMINYSRDVQNNEALKSIFGLYDSQSGVV